jgi:hypothetical protein
MTEQIDINELNTTGVKLLMAHQPKRAIDSFRKALKCLQQTLCQDDECGKENCGKECQVCCVEIDDSDECARYSPHNSMAVFDRCFVLQNDDSSKEVMSGIIMYNMALAYQHFGFVSGKSRVFDDSLRLYKMSYQVMQHGACSVQLGQYSNIVIMAITNNMAHISGHFCRNAEMKQLLACLESRLSATNTDANAIVKRDGSIYGFFYVICSCACEHCAAAVA